MAANKDMLAWCKERRDRGLKCLLGHYTDCMACDIIWEAAIRFKEAQATCHVCIDIDNVDTNIER